MSGITSSIPDRGSGFYSYRSRHSEMGAACGTYGGRERGAQGSGGET